MKKFKPGVTFGDFVVQDFKKGKSKIVDEPERNFRRGWLIWLAIVVVFGLLIVRLIELQILLGGKYRLLSDENRIRQVKISALRGTIYDRTGVALASSVKVKKKIDEGIEVDDWVRQYPLGAVAAHVIGYLGEVKEDEVGILKEKGQKYEAGDKIGRSGLEEHYEEKLRGIDGGWLAEVNNQGQVIRELGQKQQLSGEDLVTTLNSRLLTVAYEALSGKKGAVVVSDPSNGEVMAIVSSPSFDANDVAGEFTRLSSRTDMPFFNRAIGGVYPPGSTFKMITTLAALESGQVRSDFVYNDVGFISVGGYNYTNWFYTKRGGTEGATNFAKAITRSTDTFFYKVGELTGADNISTWAHKLGLGGKTNIDLGGEVTGLVGDPEWKMKVRDERWFLGNTYHMAIGQGDILTTPVQINLMTNVLAMGGKKCQLHLIDKGKNMECEELNISASALLPIREGMVGACSNGGTGYPIFDWNEGAKGGVSAYAKPADGQTLPLIACKTGTAEYMADDGKIKTHGWLTAYAPVVDPKISVTVVIEGGGEGSDVAAPVVRQILANYFGVTDTYPYSALKRGLGE